MGTAAKGTEIAIVGGGVTGLAVAYHLSRSGYVVTVYEASRGLGGLASAFPLNGTYVDKYYRHLFPGHAEILQVIEELGLGDKLRFVKTEMGFYRGGAISPFNGALDLLRFRPLSVLDRFRVGLSGLMMLAGVRNWRSLDSETAADLLRRYSGENGYQAIWEPLLRNKFGPYHTEVAATWLWDRVNSRMRSKMAARSADCLGYLVGSFQQLCDAIRARVEANGGTFAVGTPVSRLLIEDGRCQGVVWQGEAHRFARTVVTLPLPCFLRIAPDLPQAYADELKRVKYAHSLVVVLRLPESLGRFYWTSIGDADAPFAVVVEHTNMIAPQEYGGEHLVYLSAYCSDRELRMLDRTDERVFSAFSAYLGRIFPSYDEAKLIGYRVFRDRYTQPVFVKGYSAMKPGLRTPVGNLFLANTSQFYPRGRTMNGSFRLASKLKAILEAS